MTAKNEGKYAEINAFPTVVADKVGPLLHALSIGQRDYHSTNTFTTRVLNETLSIPVRVYYQPQQLLKQINHPDIEATIALCLGTRHHDGFLREKCVTALLTRETPWTVPFVVQLVGEYVLEIIQVIEQSLPNMNLELYGQFLNQNPEYSEKTECRVIRVC